ncbi:MAG: hypothetical protein HDR97_02250 [Bacteroides sp.]|nr:hypothetical protein [Bacteroides sp.]MBD5332561.1 hypothetical protein [Bacteroides sp.]
METPSTPSTPSAEPQLDTWELMRKDTPSGEGAAQDDEDEVTARVLANRRPSIWDME